MKFIRLRVRAATNVHGCDDAHHEITENWECGLVALSKRLAEGSFALTWPETTR